jgi:DNA-binding CsgD family transcriptional regulator
VLRRAYEDARRFGTQFAPLAEAWRALIFLSAGRLDDALADATSSSAGAETARFNQSLATALRVQAEVAIRKGDLVRAQEMVARMGPLLGDGSVLADHWPVALLADLDRDPRAALAILEESIATLETGHFLFGVPEFEHFPALTSLALRAGEPSVAATVVNAVTALAGRNPQVASLSGYAAHASGILHGSADALARAVAVLSAGPRPLAAAAAQRDLASLLAEGGSRSEAVGLLDVAAGTYDAAGAVADASRCRNLLRRLGVARRLPRAARPVSGWDSLSPAEVAVARVIAEGVTSQVAADQLFVSVNTVNTHLRHVFTKLDIGSRVELARLVLAHDGMPD